MNPRKRAVRWPICERFALYYEVADDGCWIWTGAKRNGYGVMKINKAKEYGHRISWRIHHGAIPEGIEVCHKCDVKDCVNPGHLFLGTHQDNMLDAWGKGIVKQPPRMVGKRHPMAKLTEQQVREIRARYAAGEKSPGLAKHFGVTKSSILYIVKRDTWRHLEAA